MTTPSEGQRRHPLSIFFGLIRLISRFLFPLIVVLFASRDSFQLWFGVFLIPAGIGVLVRYFTYRYWLTGEEMIIREGILVRNERHIPYARIQNIDLVQNPLHRMFQVALVRIETASGGKPEAVISVLSLDAVRKMRARVFASRTADGSTGAAAGSAAGDAGEKQAGPEAPPIAEPEALPLVQVSLRELVLFGFISNRGMALVAAAIGVFSQTGVFEGLFDEDRVEAMIRDASWIPDLPARDSWVWIGAAISVGLFLAWGLLRVISIAWAVIKFYGFDLRLFGEDVRARYGLFTRVSATIPRHRIQSLSTRAGFLHRRFGQTSVQVQTAGGGEGESEGPSIGRRWLAPVIEAGKVNELVQRVLPDIDLETVEWQPIATRAWVRMFRVGLVTTGIATAALVAFAGVWGLLLLPAGGALFYANARLSARHAGWALTRRAVLYKSGWWKRRMTLVQYAKIQALSITQSPFDRRHRMASLAVDTAGGARIGHGVEIRYLDADVARRIHDRLFGEAHRLDFRW